MFEFSNDVFVGHLDKAPKYSIPNIVESDLGDIEEVKPEVQKFTYIITAMKLPLSLRVTTCGFATMFHLESKKYSYQLQTFQVPQLILM